MKQEDLLRELLGLPPEEQAEVADLIERLRVRHATERPNGQASGLDLGEEAFVGMWRDRDDMKDSSGWVRRLREGEWVEQSG